MRTRRLAGTGVGLVATATLALTGGALAGCAANRDAARPSAGTSASADAAASADPAGDNPDVGTSGAAVGAGTADPAATAALSSATAALGNTSFKIKMTAGTGLSLTGAMDAPHGVGTGTLKLSGEGAALTLDSLLVDQDLYIRVPGVTANGKWTHLDVSRLPEGANVGLRPGQIDPANTARLLTTSTDVQPAGTRSYHGTLDLTRAIGITGIDKVTVDGWGKAANKVPFTADLDEQGRLTTLTVDLPAITGHKAEPLEVHYTDYGAPVTAPRPTADQVTEAPQSLYQSLGR